MAGLTGKPRLFRNSTAPVLLILAMALSGCTTVAGPAAQPVYQAPAPAQQQLRLVPYVKDMPVQRAQRALQREGFRLGRVTYEINRRTAPDTVLHQSPRANARARRGSPVDLVVAEAHARVPDLQGLHLGQARQALRQAGLRLGAVRREHSRYGQPETVIRQRPEPSVRVVPGTVVDIVIAHPGGGRGGVPDVVGLGLPQARQALRDAGYREGRVSERASNRDRPGTVLSQSPAAGARGSRQTPVDLVVAARALHPLPRLKGMTLPDARAALDRLGLRVGKVTRKPVLGGDQGVVLAQSPAPGLRVAPGTAVDLVVTQVALRQVPRVQGLPLNKARAAIEALGFGLGAVTRKATQRQDPGTVLSQSPAPSARAAAGTAIDLVVAKAPGNVGRVEVPNLLGLQSPAAAARLKKAGLRIGLMRSLRDDGHPLFSIVRQSPEPGTQVKRGTAVDIFIAKSDR